MKHLKGKKKLWKEVKPGKRMQSRKFQTDRNQTTLPTLHY
jgi:hypothetical protein